MTSHLFTLFIPPSNTVLVIFFLVTKGWCSFPPFKILLSMYAVSVVCFYICICVLYELGVSGRAVCRKLLYMWRNQVCPRLVSFPRISCQIKPGNLLLTWLVGIIHGAPASSSIISFQGRKTLSPPHSTPPTPSSNPLCREESNHFPSGCVPDHSKYIRFGELWHLVLLVLSPPYSNRSWANTFPIGHACPHSRVCIPVHLKIPARFLLSFLHVAFF